MAEPQHLKPTLVVGVGGMGCTIADRIFAMAQAGGAAASSRIAVLGFDTDENDIHRHRHLQREQLIRTSTADTLFAILARRGEALRDWFVDADQLTAELRQMTLLDGAGAIRMFSRLAFDEALRDVNTAARIDNALAGLATQDNRTRFDGRVNVLIVGSLAGGTGSGMFLQTALLLAARLRALGIAPEVRGLFLLPDIVVQAGRLAIGQVAGVRANCYAALKELNAITLHTAGRGSVAVELALLGESGLRPDGLPFDSVVLLDYESQRGGNLGRNFAAYLEIAARAAYTLLFTPIGGRFAQQAVNDARDRLAAAAQGADNRIAGIGVAAVVYPQDRLLDYLALRYGLAILDGEWLRLDAMFRDRLQRFHARVNLGEANLERPDPGAAYIQDLEQLANAERIPFFRRLREAVIVEQTDALGRTSEQSQVERYLKALEGHLLEAFWASNPALRTAAGREPLGPDSLGDREALAQDVGLFERQLRADFEAVERGLLSAVPDLFHTIVIGAALLGEGEWKDYHLESALVRGGPHLVQVRYFLYLLRRLLAQRRARLQDQRQRESIEAAFRNAFDNPETTVVETARDIALTLSAGRLPEWLDQRYKGFRRRYREYYNGALGQVRQLGQDGALRQLYDLLDQYAARLLDLLARFFGELADLRDDLRLQANQAESEHEQGTLLADGNRYVLAAGQAKQALWEELAARLQAQSADDSEINRALMRALLERFRSDAQPGLWQQVAPFSGAELFRGAMVDGYCRRQIELQHQDLYQLPVVEAIRREALLYGHDPEQYRREVIDLVAAQSAPFLALAAPGLGQPYRFWAVAEANRASFGSARDFNDLFTGGQGEAPVVEPEFPPHTLMCISVVVNLHLTDLRKLGHGLAAGANVAAPQTGSYYSAYRDLVARTLAHERVAPGQPNPAFTPHLDKRWHRPGLLPELHPELDAAHERALLDAWLLGMALELIVCTERDGRAVTLVRDWARRGEPDWEIELVAGHDDRALLASLRDRPGQVQALLERGQAVLAGDDADAQAVLAEAMNRPDLLARVCLLLADRSQATQTDPLVAAAIDVLLQHCQTLHDQAHRTLGPHARVAAFEQTATALIEAALAQLAPTLQPDTLELARALASGRLSRQLEAARAAP